MVRILANGDIVPDDDPRAQQSSRRQTTSGPPPRQGGIHYQGADDNYRQQGDVQQINIFQALNQRLVAFGIPRWNIGDIVIEPIVSIGLLLAFLMLGVHGLLFGIILFAVSRWSTHGAPDFITNIFGGGGGDRPDDSSNRGNRHQGRAGGGYRLGR